MSIDIKENKSSTKSRYRPEIDGLRAFAVVAVIINHFNKEILPGGYLGVDIFFVISGFVITSSLYQRPSKDFKDFISGFYERRIKRLVPALSIFILVTSITISLFNIHANKSLFTGIAALFGISNLHLFNLSADYFAQPMKLNVFTHTWSLGVEEQFYILFPFLIWFSGFGRQTKNGSINLFFIVAILTITSLIGFIYMYPINQPAAYFLMPLRFWEMASGCLLFISFQEKKFIKKNLEKIPSFIALVLIILIMYLPASLAVISTISTVLLSCAFIGSLKKNTGLYYVFTNKRIVYIGLISYSLYLWHWGVLSISRWTIGIHWWSIPFQIALIFGLSVSSYKFIESPLRGSSWHGKRWKTLVIGVGVLITISMNLVMLAKPLKGKLLVGSKYNRWNLNFFRETKIINNQNLPTVYLIGDSHAGHYGAVMTHLAEKKEFNFIMHPHADGLKVQSQNYREEFVLAPLRKYKNSFKKGDVIIFAGHVERYRNHEDWTKLYIEFMKQTEQLGIKYILISPTPTFKGVKDGYTCQEEWYRPSWAISNRCYGQFKKNDWFLANNVQIKNIEKFLLSNPKVFYIDAFSILCPENYCRNYDQRSFLFKDVSHLTSYGSMQLKETIETFIPSK